MDPGIGEKDLWKKKVNLGTNRKKGSPNGKRNPPPSGEGGADRLLFEPQTSRRRGAENRD